MCHQTRSTIAFIPDALKQGTKSAIEDLTTAQKDMIERELSKLHVPDDKEIVISNDLVRRVGAPKATIKIYSAKLRTDWRKYDVTPTPRARPGRAI